jgi:hypothetical protein
MARKSALKKHRGCENDDDIIQTAIHFREIGGRRRMLTPDTSRRHIHTAGSVLVTLLYNEHIMGGERGVDKLIHSLLLFISRGIKIKRQD